MNKILLSIAMTFAVLSASAQESILLDFSLNGFDQRFGPSYSAYHPVPETFPTLYQPTTKRDSIGRPYELGGPWSTNPGDFSSTQGQILYSADSGAYGMDRATILEATNMTYRESPAPPWNGGAGRDPQSLSWPTPPGVVPVDMQRGKGNWSNFGVVVSSNGLVSTAGTATAKNNNPTLLLPPEKVPTAIAVPPKNEFAFITVYDKVLKKAQLAVIALTAGGAVNGKTFPHEWAVPHAALGNVGLLTGMKLLGYIDLPVLYPTEVHACGDSMSNRLNKLDGSGGGMLPQYDLSQQSIRDLFYTGNNKAYLTRAGYAIVLSKSEGKAVFIDLQPLFDLSATMHLTTQANYNITTNIGPADTQWPYTFAYRPDWAPKVITTLSIPSPTAALGAMGKYMAFIASEDGTLRAYTMGGFNSTAPATPDDIVYKGSIPVGKNPTCIAYMGRSKDTIMVLSRGDRKIDWIKYTSAGALSNLRTLRDSRMIDPVHMEMADTHGTDASIVTVIDFEGRKIINYRFGQVRFSKRNGGKTFGMGATGTDQFECGGVMSFSGSPYCTSSTNVN